MYILHMRHPVLSNTATFEYQCRFVLSLSGQGVPGKLTKSTFQLQRIIIFDILRCYCYVYAVLVTRFAITSMGYRAGLVCRWS
jgi:hypothetical protein